MSKMRADSRRAPGASRSRGAPPPPERRLLLSALVHRTLVSFNERGHQRRVLLNVLILAQALLLLAAAPAYLSGTPAIVPLATILVSLITCLAATVFNQFFRNPVRAAYILVIGGALSVLVLVVYSAIVGTPLEAAHTSLLLIPVMLETGLLFAPEVTLLTASVSLVVTIVALLFALSVNSPGSRQETYGLVVDILGVQIVSGLIAWLLAQFIYDSAVEAQRAQEQQFAQARLAAMTAQSSEQHQRLDAAIASVQQALGRAINGDYTARVAIPDGPLAVLVASLNMLVERLSALSQGDIVRQRMEAAALPLIDVVGRVPDGATPPAASLPIMTQTPLDNVSVAVAQMQASMARRLQRVQEGATEVVGGLALTQSTVAETAQTASESLRTVGVVVAAADTLLSAARRDVELAVRALRVASSLRPADAAAPPAVPDELAESAGLDGAGNSLLGLGADLGLGVPGLTGAFEALSQTDAEALLATPDHAAPQQEGDTHAATSPDVAHKAATDANTHAATTKRTRTAKSAVTLDESSPALTELLRLLDLLRDEMGQQERGTTTLVHELGIVNRHVRRVDANVAWARHALEAVRQNAEKLQQVAGGAALPPTFTESAPISVPLAEALARPVLPTRPLAQAAEAVPVSVPVATQTVASSAPQPAAIPDSSIPVDVAVGDTVLAPGGAEESDNDLSALAARFAEQERNTSAEQE